MNKNPTDPLGRPTTNRPRTSTKGTPLVSGNKFHGFWKDEGGHVNLLGPMVTTMVIKPERKIFNDSRCTACGGFIVEGFCNCPTEHC